MLHQSTPGARAVTPRRAVDDTSRSSSQSALTDPQLRHDVGPAWPPSPGTPPDPPRWADANALIAVWRDSLTMALGGLHPEFAKRLPETVRPDGPWNIDPEPESDADIAQAISAKAHLSFRMLPLLAEAQLVGLEPLLADVLAIPAPDEQLLEYATRAATKGPLSGMTRRRWQLGRRNADPPRWTLAFDPPHGPNGSARCAR